jgi:hypothetical protein
MLEFVEETLQAKGDYHTAIVAARLHDDECFEYVIKKSGVHLCMEASSRIAGYSDATQARLMQTGFAREMCEMATQCTHLRGEVR